MFQVSPHNSLWSVVDQAVDIMKKFLVKNPARRLGSIKGGVDKIKSHPWFVGFDWTALEVCD